MYKKAFLSGLFPLFFFGALAQPALQKGHWRASLLRQDGHAIAFNLDVETLKGKTAFYVLNGAERMLVDDITIIKDSLFIDMPVFESSFKLKIVSKDSLAGTWIKRGALKNTLMPFVASANQKYRFVPVNGNSTVKVGGKWKMEFITGEEHEPAVGNFVQNGNVVTGSILTPTGDYRFLEGIITGDFLQLSAFDGNHALLFTATIKGDIITNGELFSSNAPAGKWTALRDEKATLPAGKLTELKDGQDGTLDFSFIDLDGKKVSIHDDRFKNKVVVIQLMGSWCPNCMDETAFLSAYYNKNKGKGIEMIGLAYEYTTDLERSKASLRKFQKRFDIQYPLLITPVAISDPLRTQKTLPQLTDIKVFPTTLILDKNGKIAEISTDFFGPGTGEYYVHYKENFEKKLRELLNQ